MFSEISEYLKITFTEMFQCKLKAALFDEDIQVIRLIRVEHGTRKFAFAYCRRSKKYLTDHWMKKD